MPSANWQIRSNGIESVKPPASVAVRGAGQAAVDGPNVPPLTIANAIDDVPKGSAVTVPNGLHPARSGFAVQGSSGSCAAGAAGFVVVVVHEPVPTQVCVVFVVV
jgi:hypothetical protein